MTPLDRFEVLSFDCYGTLVDWESGILGALRPYLSGHGVVLSDDEILHRYARLESAAQEGIFAPYRHVLGRVMRGFAQEYDLPTTDSDRDLLTESLPEWPLFDDTVDALRRLAQHLRLGVISNIDDDLFALTLGKLGVTFDWVLTAEEAVSYKPSPRNFEIAAQRAGVPRGQWLHASQSLYHDIAPAKRLGISAVWVNRRRGREGFGATPPAAAVPDLEVADLRELADRVEAR